MATFESVVIEGLPELERTFSPETFWAAIERLIPRAFLPVTVDMRGRAPRGRSGKLGRGFDVQVRRVAQGFVQGILAVIGARVPYGHLVEFGHRIIARGPGRKGLKNRLQRGQARTALKARRLAGPRGFVSPRPFAEPSVVAHEAQTVDLIERLLEDELSRA